MEAKSSKNSPRWLEKIPPRRISSVVECMPSDICASECLYLPRGSHWNLFTPFTTDWECFATPVLAPMILILILIFILILILILNMGRYLFCWNDKRKINNTGVLFNLTKQMASDFHCEILQGSSTAFSRWPGWAVAPCKKTLSLLSISYTCLLDVTKVQKMGFPKYRHKSWMFQRPHTQSFKMYFFHGANLLDQILHLRDIWTPKKIFLQHSEVICFGCITLFFVFCIIIKAVSISILICL